MVIKFLFSIFLFLRTNATQQTELNFFFYMIYILMHDKIKKKKIRRSRYNYCYFFNYGDQSTNPVFFFYIIFIIHFRTDATQQIKLNFFYD